MYPYIEASKTSFILDILYMHYEIIYQDNNSKSYVSLFTILHMFKHFFFILFVVIVDRLILKKGGWRCYC